MKLELVHTIEHDGEWFKVLKDGMTDKCWSVDADGKNRDSKRELATIYYENYKNFVKNGSQTTIILSEEI